MVKKRAKKLKLIKLPTTLVAFDALVDTIVKKYKLTDAHHAAAIISVAIRHIPNDEAHTTLEYLGNSVLKNLANYVAYHKGETLKHTAQVDQLINVLTQDPNNQQAFDELNKAANEGSEPAKEALLKLGSTLTPTNTSAVIAG